MDFNYLKNMIESKYCVHTIILYGSFAKGNNDEYSDIDIIAFWDENEELQDKSNLGSNQLDLWIYPTDKMTDYNEFIRVNGGIILLDCRNAAEVFISNIKHAYETGPIAKSPEEKENILKWVRKMYLRSLKADLEGAYRKSLLLAELLPIYFELKDMWYLGSKYGFEFLRDNDESAYNLYSSLYMGKDPDILKDVIKYLDTLV
jgi:predicted nucleotidyltransferase